MRRADRIAVAVALAFVVYAAVYGPVQQRNASVHACEGVIPVRQAQAHVYRVNAEADHANHDNPALPTGARNEVEKSAVAEIAAAQKLHDVVGTGKPRCEKRYPKPWFWPF